MYPSSGQDLGDSKTTPIARSIALHWNFIYIVITIGNIIITTDMPFEFATLPAPISINDTSRLRDLLRKWSLIKWELPMQAFSVYVDKPDPVTQQVNAYISQIEQYTNNPDISATQCAQDRALILAKFAALIAPFFEQRSEFYNTLMEVALTGSTGVACDLLSLKMLQLMHSSSDPVGEWATLKDCVTTMMRLRPATDPDPMISLAEMVDLIVMISDILSWCVDPNPVVSFPPGTAAVPWTMMNKDLGIETTSTPHWFFLSFWHNAQDMSPVASIIICLVLVTGRLNCPIDETSTVESWNQWVVGNIISGSEPGSVNFINSTIGLGASTHSAKLGTFSTPTGCQSQRQYQQHILDGRYQDLLRIISCEYVPDNFPQAIDPASVEAWVLRRAIEAASLDLSEDPLPPTALLFRSDSGLLEWKSHPCPDNCPCGAAMTTTTTTTTPPPQ